MKTSNFETLDTGNVLVTCDEVVDHQDQVPALQDLCEAMQSATTSLEAKMLNDGELEFKVLITIPKIVRKRDKVSTLPAAAPEEPASQEEEPTKRSHHKGKN